MKYMGKTTDTFGRVKFWLPQNSLFAASRETTKLFAAILMLQIEKVR